VREIVEPVVFRTSQMVLNRPSPITSRPGALFPSPMLIAAFSASDVRGLSRRSLQSSDRRVNHIPDVLFVHREGTIFESEV
jgi:hypothetical protein